MVESAALTAATASAGASVGGVGKSTAGVFDSLRKLLATSPAPGRTTPGTATPVTLVNFLPDEPQPSDTGVYPDPSGITVGLDRRELLSKFGQPSLKMAVSDGSETWWYRPPDQDGAAVTLRDEKVAVVVLPRKRQPARASAR